MITEEQDLIPNRTWRNVWVHEKRIWCGLGRMPVGLGFRGAEVVEVSLAIRGVLIVVESRRLLLNRTQLAISSSLGRHSNWFRKFLWKAANGIVRAV